MPKTRGVEGGSSWASAKRELYHPQLTEREQVTQAWGDWADQLGRGIGGWDWFVTLTWRDITPQGTWTKPGLAFCQRGFRQFVDQVGRRRGMQDVEYIAGWEYQVDRGVPHVHALLGHCRQVRRMDLVDWWYDRYGIGRVLPYDPERGAAFYISKYVTKPGLVELKFSAGLQPVRAQIQEGAGAKGSP